MDSSRSVRISGDATNTTVVTGDNNVIGDGNIVGDDNLILKGPITLAANYVLHPNTLYADARAFVLRHPLIVAIYLLIQGALGYLFWEFKDRFYLAYQTYLSVALLTTVVVISFYILARLHGKQDPEIRRVSRYWLLLGVIALTAILVISGWNVKSIAFPTPFNDDNFGIALATFGRPGTLRANRDGYETTALLEDALDNIISNDLSNNTLLSIRRIGVINTDRESSQRIHDQLHAKLLIRGDISTKDSSINVDLRVFQSSEFIQNPDFPQPVPLELGELALSFALPSEDHDKLKEIIKNQSRAIAEFSIGLANYQNRHYNRAIAHLKNAQTLFDKADKIAGEEQDLKQNSGLLNFYLGRSYQVRGRFEESIVALDKALESSPDELAVMQTQLYNYRVIKDLDARQKLYERLVRESRTVEESQEVIAAYNLARTHSLMENKEAALNEYRLLIQKQPDYFVAYLGKADVLMSLGERDEKQGNFDEAKDRFDNAQREIDNAKSYTDGDTTRLLWIEYTQARWFEKQERYREAADAYTRAIELDTEMNFAYLHYGKAEAHVALNERELATASYQNLIDISPLRYWSHSEYADYLFELAEYKAAEKEYKAALVEPSYDPGLIHTKLAFTYAKLEQEEEAIDSFERAISTMRSEQGYIYHEYGRILAQFGEIDDAVKKIEAAIAYEASSKPQWLHNLAILYGAQGDSEREKQQYTKLLSNCKTIEDDIERLSKILMRAGELELDMSSCPLTIDG